MNADWSSRAKGPCCGPRAMPKRSPSLIEKERLQSERLKGSGLMEGGESPSPRSQAV